MMNMIRAGLIAGAALAGYLAGTGLPIGPFLFCLMWAGFIVAGWRLLVG